MTTHYRREVWAPIGYVGHMSLMMVCTPVDGGTAGGIDGEPSVCFQMHHTGNIKSVQVLLDAFAEEVIIFLRELESDNLLRH